MKKSLIISLSILGIGTLIFIMKKRRRLLEKEEQRPIYNKVARDLGGTVPEALYNYLKVLGDDEKIKDNYKFWGYKKILEFSNAISQNIKDDVLVLLGIEMNLTEILGQTIYLMYSKKGYPDSLILVSHDGDTGNLIYHSSINFDILS